MNVDALGTKNGEVKIQMTLTKETKGTYVYGNPESVVPTLYIKKEAFDSSAPKVITLIVTS